MSGYSIAQRAFAAAALLAGAATMVLVTTLAFTDSTVLPFWDHWAFIQQLANGDMHYSVAELWHQHNEHRIFIPKLLMLLDVYVFHGRNTFLLCMTLLFQGLQAWLIYTVIRALKLDRLTMVAICGLALTLLYFPAQLDNFVWAFQVAFILATLLNSVALLCLVKALWPAESGGAESARKQELKSWPLLVCSIAAALSAVLSLASGLFVWPFLIALALLKKAWRVAGLLFVLWVAITALYLHNYQTASDHANPLETIRHPWAITQYVTIYLAGCWFALGESVATTVGAAGLVLSLILIAIGVKRARTLQRPEVFLLALMALVLFTAFVTAMGRIKFAQAYASRYQSVAVLFWVALVLLTVTWLSRWAKPGAALGWIALVAFGVMIGAPLTRVKAIAAPYGGRAGQWRVEEKALLSGVGDVEMGKSVIPDGHLYFLARFLKRKNLSLFFDNREAASLGENISERYVKISAAGCDGAIDGSQIESEADTSGLRISGWAWDRRENRSFHGLVTTDGRDRIIGFGVGGYVSMSAGRTYGEQAGQEAGWFSYGPLHEGVNQFHIYGVLPDNKHVCAIAPRTNIEKEIGYPAGTSTLIAALSNCRRGVFRNGQWWEDIGFDVKAHAFASQLSVFGQPADIPITGDWDGTGKLRIGVFRKGQWWLDMNGNEKWDPGVDKIVVFGQAGDIPVVGDWDGSGKLRIGVFRKGQWWLDMNGNQKWDPGVDKVVVFGQAGDIPVVGDWDGSGKLRCGVYRSGQWWLDMNGDFQWQQGIDKIVLFGSAGDLPVVGNWDSIGKLRIGIFRKGQWFLDYSGSFIFDENSDNGMIFGQAGDVTTVLQWPAAKP